MVPQHALDLGQLFPALTAVEPFKGHAQNGVDISREQSLHALRALLGAIATRFRLVLFVDDLQWADHDGLELLAHALVPPGAPNVLLIACSRSEECPPALRMLPAMTSLSIQPLSAAHAEALARASLPGAPASDIARVVRETGGHPLFVQELARLMHAAPSAGSGGLDDVIRARFMVLHEYTQTLMELVAVAGAPVPRRVLTLAAGNSPDKVEQELHRLYRERFIRSVGSALIDTFHDRVREALLAGLAPAPRRERHRQLAMAYQQATPDEVAQLAVHWAGAGEAQAAYGYARTAADRAIQGFAYSHAAEFFALALSFATSSEESQQLRICRAGALRRARRPLDAAHALIEAAGFASGDERRRLRLQAVEQLLIGGELDGGLEELAVALRESGFSTPKSLPSRLVNALARRIRLRLHDTFLGKVVRTHGNAEDVDALTSAASALSMIDGLMALGYHTQALMTALRLGDKERLARAFSVEACTEAGWGSFSEAQRLIRRADELIASTESSSTHPDRKGARLVLSVQLGRWSEALALPEFAHEAVPETRELNAWQYAARELYLSHCELNLGRFLDLQERCDRVRREVAERNDHFLELALGVSFVPLVHLMRDQVEDARRVIDEMTTRIWRRSGGGYFHALLRAASMSADLYEGRHRRALQAISGLGGTALIGQSHYGRVYLRYLGASAALGLIRQGAGNAALLSLRVRTAFRSLQKDQVPWARPYGDLLAAGLRHLQGQSASSARHLEQARAGFVRFGSEHMVEIVDRARSLSGHGEAAEEAESRLRIRGVVCPPRFAIMLAPAFG
jgi:hypothetical protein